MSLIASFYTMPAEKLQALDAAEPVSKTVQVPFLLFFSKKRIVTVDGSYDFLRQNAVEQTWTQYSGTAFCDLDLVLEKKGQSLFGMALAGPSKALSTKTGASWAVFDRAVAQQAVAKLRGMALRGNDVETYYEAEGQPQDVKEGTPAVLAAYAQILKWLDSVRDSEIGLLVVE